MDGARRGILGAARPAQRCRVALELVRDRQSREVLAEHDHEPEVGVVERVQPLVELASERREQADARRADGSRSLRAARAPRGSARRPAPSRARADARSSASVRSSMRNPSSSSNRTARRSRSGSSTKIDSETARMTPAAEIRAAVVRVVRLAGTHAHGDRVEREVARREVGVDPVADRREVDGLVDAVRDDTPRAVPLGEREDATPPKRRAKRFAASRGSAQATSRSRTGRRRSSSRTAPPTTHASSSPRISRSRSSIDRDPPRTARARVRARRDLVRDRARDACVLLDEDSVADERDGRARRDRRRRARPRARPSRSSRRRGVARPRRAPPCPSCRDGSRPRTRRGRCRSRSGRSATNLRP